jgi:hypothetical protein
MEKNLWIFIPSSMLPLKIETYIRLFFYKPSYQQDIQNVPEGKLIFWEVIVSVIPSELVYIFVCLFRALYSSQYTVQTTNTPCPHTRCKVNWCWWWNFLKYIILSKLYRPATATYIGYSSASRSHVVTIRRISRKWTLINWQLTLWMSELYYDRRSDGHLSWYQATIWGLWPDFYYCQKLAGLLIWGALSDDRTGLSLTIDAVFASAVILRSESRGDHDHILLSQIWDSPNLENQVPVFISPRNRVICLTLCFKLTCL